MYTISGPPASTVTDEATSTVSSSGGSPQDSSNGTLIPAYWDTDAMGLATSMGTSPLRADPGRHDDRRVGHEPGIWSRRSAGKTCTLQFTGAEVKPRFSGSAIVLEQGGGGSGIWASHPSAIGYRRQGYTTGGSHGGSGSGTITIAAVAPEFDSGMNSGADPDEMERLGNFGQGAGKPDGGAVAADFAGRAADVRGRSRWRSAFCPRPPSGCISR